MTEQEINMAIAEACGWTCQNGWWDHPTLPSNGGAMPEPPDYTNDLNAMHEAWLILSNYDKREFHINLGLLIEKYTKEWGDLLLLDQRSLIANATAAQRAEAFLRTVGKWKD